MLERLATDFKGQGLGPGIRAVRVRGESGLGEEPVDGGS
jgi:hypothetical protein